MKANSDREEPPVEDKHTKPPIVMISVQSALTLPYPFGYVANRLCTALLMRFRRVRLPPYPPHPHKNLASPLSPSRKVFCLPFIRTDVHFDRPQTDMAVGFLTLGRFAQKLKANFVHFTIKIFSQNP